MTHAIRPGSHTPRAATTPRAVVLRRFTVAVRGGRTPRAAILVNRRGTLPAAGPRRPRRDGED